MRGYVMVGSTNLKESKAFYDAILAVIGVVSIYEDEVCVGYAHEGNSDVEFYITKPANGEPVTFGNGTQISFLTESTEEVDMFHKTALDLGAKNEGNPGFRPNDSDAYYAYIRDPDGNKICSYTSVNV
tara:strand:- start:907 stop:1290 length:384 start_codon:yes stop_codon:yes gene_type:complete